MLSLLGLGLPAGVLGAAHRARPTPDQGDVVRIMYVHVPSAITAYLAFGLTALGSVLYL